MQLPERIADRHPTAQRAGRCAAPTARRALAVLLAAVVPLLAAPAVGQAETAPVANPNNYQCTGALGPGKAEPGHEETPVQYKFMCNGPITGYQLQTQLPIAGSEGAPLITNYQGTPLKESFSCSGSFPGYAVNCVGAPTAEPYEKFTGQFEIGWKLCTEPRVDALLTVTYAYLEKGAITQAISGPFDLGRPSGCPSTPSSGKDRLHAYQGREPKASKQDGKRHMGHGRHRGRPKSGPAGAHGKIDRPAAKKQ